MKIIQAFQTFVIYPTYVLTDYTFLTPGMKSHTGGPDWVELFVILVATEESNKQLLIILL